MRTKVTRFAPQRGQAIPGSRVCAASPGIRRSGMPIQHHGSYLPRHTVVNHPITSKEPRPGGEEECHRRRMDEWPEKARAKCSKHVISGCAPPLVTARSEHDRTRQWRETPGRQEKGSPPRMHTHVRAARIIAERSSPRNGRAGGAASRNNIRMRACPHNSRALATGNCRQPVRVVL